MGSPDPHATRYNGVHDAFFEGIEEPRTRVHLVGTGGTIAHQIDGPDVLSTADLVERFPAIEAVADVTTHDVTVVDGTVRSRSDYVQHLRGREGAFHADPVWFDIHDHIRSHLEADDPPEAFVVTHGSNSVEETAYFLDLTLPPAVPVALTAAQRWHGMLGEDGPWNLLTAVRVAADPGARGRGAFLVVSDRVQASRDATKLVSGRPDAWRSGDRGDIGRIDKRGVVEFFDAASTDAGAAPAFDLPDDARERFPHIEVIYSVAGAEGELIEAAIDRGADGLVVAAFPTGDAAANQRPALETAVDAGMPVVMSHRGIHGPPTTEHLDGPDGFIWANDLRPQKARILLGLGLLETTDPARLQQLFLDY